MDRDLLMLDGTLFVVVMSSYVVVVAHASRVGTSTCHIDIQFHFQICK